MVRINDAGDLLVQLNDRVGKLTTHVSRMHEKIFAPQGRIQKALRKVEAMPDPKGLHEANTAAAKHNYNKLHFRSDPKAEDVAQAALALSNLIAESKASALHDACFQIIQEFNKSTGSTRFDKYLKKLEKAGELDGYKAAEVLDYIDENRQELLEYILEARFNPYKIPEKGPIKNAFKTVYTLVTGDQFPKDYNMTHILAPGRYDVMHQSFIEGHASGRQLDLPNLIAKILLTGVDDDDKIALQSHPEDSAFDEREFQYQDYDQARPIELLLNLCQAEMDARFQAREDRQRSGHHDSGSNN